LLASSLPEESLSFPDGRTLEFCDLIADNKHPRSK
jgi:hypothetical protein